MHINLTIDRSLGLVYWLGIFRSNPLDSGNGDLKKLSVCERENGICERSELFGPSFILGL